ncbi:MAG: STAS/SEC14 domain-containing protein [Alphaproteobacteria bacterium]|nr:STAS/SEC14 domain-containing protein [Alphaproteobacteria bacterium]
MISLVSGFSGNIVGVSAKGRLTREDYEGVLIPAVEKALADHEKVRLYYELGAEFAGVDVGAMWEDFKVGMAHYSKWERIAIVTDVEWLAHSVNAFAFMMPCPVKVFKNGEASAAKEWIAEA